MKRLDDMHLALRINYYVAFEGTREVVLGVISRQNFSAKSYIYISLQTSTHVLIFLCSQSIL